MSKTAAPNTTVDFAGTVATVRMTDMTVNHADGTQTKDGLLLAIEGLGQRVLVYPAADGTLVAQDPNWRTAN